MSSRRRHRRIVRRRIMAILTASLIILAILVVAAIFVPKAITNMLPPDPEETEKRLASIESSEAQKRRKRVRNRI